MGVASQRAMTPVPFHHITSYSNSKRPTADVSVNWSDHAHGTATVGRSIESESTMAGQGRRKSGGTVTQECIQELLDFFIKNAYKARNVDQRVRDSFHLG